MSFRRSLTRPGHRRPGTLWMSAFVLGSVLAGCTVGPDFVPPTAAAPDDWTSWRSGDDSLRRPVAATDTLPTDWWRAYGDPVLDRLQKRAFEASPDLQTAALHFAQARVQRRVVGSPGVPEVGFSGAMARQRSSEYGAGTRLIDAIADDRDPLVDILSEPFTLYQAGFDASWEIDLWGRVRRAVEAAEADVTRQAALLDYSRLSVTSEVARNYLEMRTTQRQIAVAREDLTVLEGRLALIEALARSGVADYLDLQRQRIEVATLRARLPGLREQEAARANQIALLLGERPGGLRAALAPRAAHPHPALPALALGLPSEVALRRPDIRVRLQQNN
jgi:outer membrane protein TolC